MPTLLTLPRELRDHIYQYLHRDLSVIWSRGSLYRGSPMSKQIEIQIYDAPILSVLLTHSRLHEYLQCSVFKHMALTLRVASKNLDSDEVSPTCKPKYMLGYEGRPSAAASGLLLRVARVTCFIDCGEAHTASWMEIRGRLVEDVDDFLAMFLMYVPALSCVKIAMRYKTGGAPHTDSFYQSFNDSEFLKLPYPTISKLPLAQRIEGYRLSYRMIMGTSADQFAVVHVPTKLACYSYRHPCATEVYWTDSEVLQEWPNTKLGQPSLDKC